MNPKEALSQLNFVSQCKRYGISLWQCPSFLFLIMGTLVIASMLATYFIGNRYADDPEIVALIVIAVTTGLLILGYVVTSSFERLAQVSRMKSEFVGIVSHQLRTPLSSINWILELFLTQKIGSLNQKQLENISLMRENVRRMNNLVNDLLNVVRIEQGKLELMPEKFPLGNLLQKAMSDFEIFAKANNISIILRIPQDIIVFADQSKARLVIENLLDNAIRYIKENGKVEVRAKKLNAMAMVMVSDTGVGVPKEEQKYIFQKFFRSQNIMRHQTEGSGLGLYIAKAIIEKSGGKIGFESEEGNGSTFWFTLPLA